MRILVTGASGLLGLNLALEAAKEHNVTGLVHRHPLKTDAFQVIACDLLAESAIERILDQTQPDWVIHCAAMAVVDECEAKPELAAELNTEAPRKLAAIVTRGGARLVYISTDAVFDGRRGDYTEEDLPNPLSVYARTKLLGEQAVAAMDPTALIVRVNLFGWSLTGTRSLAEFFYYNLHARTKVLGFTDVFFCPLLANDLAHVLIRMLEMKLSGLYHVVSSECLSKYEFGIRLANLFDLDAALITPSSVADGALQAARSPNLTLRIDKLVQALGAPTPDVTAGLQHFYQLYHQAFPEQIRRLA